MESRRTAPAGGNEDRAVAVGHDDRAATAHANDRAATAHANDRAATAHDNDLAAAPRNHDRDATSHGGVAPQPALDDPAGLFGEFLKASRARVTPEDVGLPVGGRRRVPGLRREELAQLAGVSVDYYVRLEQGRAAHPSAEVLDALARALRLDEVGRRHLHELVSRRALPAGPVTVRPALRHLLDRLDAVPAFVLDRRMNVLAWNRLAAALIVDFSTMPPEHRNTARFMFLDERARSLYMDWEVHARASVGILRRAAGLDRDDRQLAGLIGELSMKSPEFARWWGEHAVSEKTYGSKRYRHSLVGEVTVHYETLALPDHGQTLITYSTEPGSESETALRLLAAWAAEPLPDAR